MEEVLVCAKPARCVCSFGLGVANIDLSVADALAPLLVSLSMSPLVATCRCGSKLLLRDMLLSGVVCAWLAPLGGFADANVDVDVEVDTELVRESLLETGWREVYTQKSVRSCSFGEIGFMNAYRGIILVATRRFPSLGLWLSQGECACWYRHCSVFIAASRS